MIMKITIVSTKRLFVALMTMLTISVSANAMSYEQARNEALFLTDKMAYELNLTDEQYEAAYEINLDYLMGVTGRDDVFGTYWERRNLDLSYILFDWQWNAFIAASYFYRPLYWDAGYWHFGIYARYPHRDYFYFGRPHFYATYRGAHAWHRIGGPGYYHGHRDHFRGVPGREHFGMHDRWNRGDFRSNRQSSTRVTGSPSHRGGFGSRNGSMQGQRQDNGQRRIEQNRRMNQMGGSTTHERQRSMGSPRNDGSFGGSRNSGSFGGSRNSGSFGGSRNSGSFSRSSGSSHSSGSFGGGSRSVSGSHSSGMHSSGGSRSGGSHVGGGSHSGGSHGGGSHSGGMGGRR